MKKSIFSFIVLGILLLVLTNCGERNKNNSKISEQDLGSMVYKQYCKSCHGANGKLGLSGAKDLTQSQMDLEERKAIIINGKNTMTPYKKILSQKEIDAVARYTLQFTNSNE